MRLFILLTSFILFCIDPKIASSKIIGSNDVGISFIKNVEITKKNGTYTLTANVRSKLGVIYYVVEDGHHEWVSETKVKIGKTYPKWERIYIELIFPKNKYPDNLPMIVYLYEKDEKGKMLHTFAKKITL